MDKLLKAIDVLRLWQQQQEGSGTSRNRKVDHQHLSNNSADKERQACAVIRDCLLLSSVKHHLDYNVNFSLSIRLLFALFDHSIETVRFDASDCLDTIFRNLLIEGSGSKVHVELYRELQRNGPAKCLQAALRRFGELAHLIRPVKSRLFARHIATCVRTICIRPEEAVQEALALSVGKFWPILGAFFSEQECKEIIESVWPNIQLQSAVSRRTASTIIVNVCKYSRKSRMFTDSVATLLLDCLQSTALNSENMNGTIGALLTIRQLWPLISTYIDNAEKEQYRVLDKGIVIRVTSTNTTSRSAVFTTSYMVQLIRLLISLLCTSNSQISVASLELLVQMFVRPARTLLQVITNQDGLEYAVEGIALISSSDKMINYSTSTFDQNQQPEGLRSLMSSNTDLSSALSFGDSIQHIDDATLIDRKMSTTPIDSTDNCTILNPVITGIVAQLSVEKLNMHI